MEAIINKENDWDHMTEAIMAEGHIEMVTHKEMVIALKATKPGKDAGPFEVSAEMISASGKVGISAMMKLLPTCIGWKKECHILYLPMYKSTRCISRPPKI